MNFWCLDLYFGFWTVIWASGLVIWASGLWAARVTDAFSATTLARMEKGNKNQNSKSYVALIPEIMSLVANWVPSKISAYVWWEIAHNREAGTKETFPGLQMHQMKISNNYFALSYPHLQVGHWAWICQVYRLVLEGSGAESVGHIRGSSWRDSGAASIEYIGGGGGGGCRIRS